MTIITGEGLWTQIVGIVVSLYPCPLSLSALGNSQNSFIFYTLLASVH